jgi:hypothetical protein
MFRRCFIFLEMAPELKLALLPVMFTKTTLGPDGGFAGEERLVKRQVAERYFEENIAVPPTEENRKGLWVFNPDTDQYDTFIERDAKFLNFAARKRQWLDVYWRVNTGYLVFSRVGWGQGWRVNCPLRKQDICQKLWEQQKVRVDWRLIEFREKDQRTGIEEFGHNFCWLYLPGAEELQIDREVYDNKRVKVRVHIFKCRTSEGLY